MGQVNWTELSNGLSSESLDKGVTDAVPGPNGGVQTVFGFNSLSAADGAAGFWYNRINGTVSDEGISIRCYIRRGISGGSLGSSPFLFVCAQGPDINDNAYILGLSDDDPHRIVISKGPLSRGAPSSESTTILKASSDSFTEGTWMFLRLDATANDNGDVLIDAFRSTDMLYPAPDSETWNSIPGIDTFVDDALGVSSGSLPFLTGRVGFGFASQHVARRGFFEHLSIRKQT